MGIEDNGNNGHENDYNKERANEVYSNTILTRIYRDLARVVIDDVFTHSDGEWVYDRPMKDIIKSDKIPGKKVDIPYFMHRRMRENYTSGVPMTELTMGILGIKPFQIQNREERISLLNESLQRFRLRAEPGSWSSIIKGEFYIKSKSGSENDFFYPYELYNDHLDNLKKLTVAYINFESMSTKLVEDMEPELTKPLLRTKKSISGISVIPVNDWSGSHYIQEYARIMNNVTALANENEMPFAIDPYWPETIQQEKNVMGDAKFRALQTACMSNTLWHILSHTLFPKPNYIPSIENIATMVNVAVDPLGIRIETDLPKTEVRK